MVPEGIGEMTSLGAVNMCVSEQASRRALCAGTHGRATVTIAGADGHLTAGKRGGQAEKARPRATPRMSAMTLRSATAEQRGRRRPTQLLGAQRQMLAEANLELDTKLSSRSWRLSSKRCEKPWN